MTAPSLTGACKAEQKKPKQMQERSCFSLSLCRLCLVASQHGTEYGENIFAAANKGRPFVLFSVYINARQEPKDDTQLRAHVLLPPQPSPERNNSVADLRFHLSASEQRSGALLDVYHHGDETNLALHCTIKALMEGKQAGKPR